MDLPKIEKGVPIPQRNRQGKWRDLFRAMKVGDSILYKGSRTTVWPLVHHWLGKGNYATRMEGKFVRIWRIK